MFFFAWMIKGSFHALPSGSADGTRTMPVAARDPRSASDIEDKVQFQSLSGTSSSESASEGIVNVVGRMPRLAWMIVGVPKGYRLTPCATIHLLMPSPVLTCRMLTAAARASSE